MRFDNGEKWSACTWYENAERRVAKDPACVLHPVGTEVIKTYFILKIFRKHFKLTLGTNFYLLFLKFYLQGEKIECIDRSEHSKETFPNLSGGKFDHNLCQLEIGGINSNYTSNWTVVIQLLDDSEVPPVYIPIKSTKLPEVTGSEDSISVTSRQAFQTSCTASFGVPQPAG